MTLSNVVIRPYKNGSKSAIALATLLSQKLGHKVRRLYTEGSKFRPNVRNVIINWGNSSPFLIKDATVLNLPGHVAVASNKLDAFCCWEEWNYGQVPPEDRPHFINYPTWTTDPNVAHMWVAEGSTVFARMTLTGCSGAGIVELKLNDDMGAYTAPLFTKYIKKKAEYRVHVAFDKIIDIQQKKKRTDFVGEPNYLVRNHHNGWVYCREGITPPTGIEQQALLAVRALGLHFGAVDIIYNEHHNKCYVLEVNTAPGVEGTTLEKYANSFVEELNERAD
jgi:hypothetical protein